MWYCTPFIFLKGKESNAMKELMTWLNLFDAIIVEDTVSITKDENTFYLLYKKKTT